MLKIWYYNNSFNSKLCFKKHFLLLLILLLAIFLRFWQLGLVPVGVTHDELGYIYNSYSISQTGKNVFGEFLPLLSWLYIGNFPFLPVPIYMSVPFFWFFGLSAFVGRLPSAILGTLDVFLLYILVKQIFNKTSLALLSALFLAISPWHLHFSRSAYDPNFALFFYLLGIVIFIYEVRSKKLQIFSVVAMLFAIFSYRGMNPIFPILVIALVWYGIAFLNMSRKQLVIFFVSVGFVVLVIASVILINGRAYTAEARIWEDPTMQENIDTQIREAQGPLFVRRLFLNKPVYVVNKLRENYIRAYSPEFLFLYTEPSKIYSIWSRGRIYFLDLVFIILGVAYLYKINKYKASFVLLLVLIGGLPGMIGGFMYSARNFFLSALFPILSAGGVLFLLRNVVVKKLRIIVIVVLVISYMYIFGSYLFDYYGKYAFYGGEAWVKSLKDISLLIADNKKKYDKIIIGQTSFGDFLQYAFYSKIDPIRVQDTWRDRKRGRNISFSIENIVFTDACLDNGKEGSPSFEKFRSVLYVVHDDCVNRATPSAFVKDYFGNTVWKIYNINK